MLNPGPAEPRRGHPNRQGLAGARQPASCSAGARVRISRSLRPPSRRRWPLLEAHRTSGRPRGPGRHPNPRVVSRSTLVRRCVAAPRWSAQNRAATLQPNAATEFGHHLGKPVEVLRCQIGHDVAILRSTDYTPRTQRQASNNDEANIGLDDADEKLVERRRTQRARRAESRNSNSLRVNEIVSLRFTTSGRCPSARNLSRRTRSPSESRDCCVRGSAIDPNITEPMVGERVRHASTGR